MTRAHFIVSIAGEAEGFSVEVSERLAMTRGRTTLSARESATSTPEEVGDLVRDLIVEMLHGKEPPRAEW